MEDRPRFWTIGLSIAALTISLGAALFSYLQWRELKLAREQQQRAVELSSQLSLSSVMAAERSTIVAQRNGTLYKPPTLIVGADQTALISSTLNDDVPIEIWNNGTSTAYDIRVAGADEFSRHVKEDEGRNVSWDVNGGWMKIQLLRSKDSIKLRLWRKHPLSASDRGLLIKRLINYFVYGMVKFRDAFEKEYEQPWCNLLHLDAYGGGAGLGCTGAAEPTP